MEVLCAIKGPVCVHCRARGQSECRSLPRLRVDMQMRAYL